VEAVQQGDVQDSHSNDPLTVERVVLRNASGRPTFEFRPGEDLTVEVELLARARIERPALTVWVSSRFGSMFQASMLLDGHQPDYVEGSGKWACTFKALPLIPQLYTISLVAHAADGVTRITKARDVAFLNVVGSLNEAGLEGQASEALLSQITPVVIPYEWILPSGQRIAVSMRAPVSAASK
jgi:hypothetical protein